MVELNQTYVLDSTNNREYSDELREVWTDNELGNDYCYYPLSYVCEDYDEGDEDIPYPKLFDLWMKNKDKNILLHFWW